MMQFEEKVSVQSDIVSPIVKNFSSQHGLLTDILIGTRYEGQKDIHTVLTDSLRGQNEVTIDLTTWGDMDHAFERLESIQANHITLQEWDLILEAISFENQITGNAYSYDLFNKLEKVLIDRCDGEHLFFSKMTIEGNFFNEDGGKEATRLQYPSKRSYVFLIEETQQYGIVNYSYWSL